MPILNQGQVSINWTCTQSLSETVAIDQQIVTMNQTVTLTDGSGSNQFNKLWEDEGSLNAGATLTLDLSSLVREVLDGSYNISIGNLCGIFIKNTSTTLGNELRINPGNTIFSSGDAMIDINPNGFFCLGGFYQPYTIDDTVELMNSNASGSVSYQITILGIN